MIVIRLALLSMLTLMLALAAPGSALASTTQVIILQDDANLVYMAWTNPRVPTFG
jgi:hypothetical protein